MCIAFYTVNPDSFYSFEEQRAVIVRVFKDDELVETVSFPIANLTQKYKTEKQAEEYGRLAVRSILNQYEADA